MRSASCAHSQILRVIVALVQGTSIHWNDHLLIVKNDHFYLSYLVDVYLAVSSGRVDNASRLQREWLQSISP